ncbi:hypothetical protein EV368DRAFT_87537 [Lentinula lateritia]|nr:hypothetical protein EV368DRAFT_87537 [Lentinula lateritia]
MAHPTPILIMSSSTGGNRNLPFILSEQNHLRGPKNFKSWHQQMLIQGKLRGMLNYWEGKVNIPTLLLPSPNPNATSDPCKTWVRIGLKGGFGMNGLRCSVLGASWSLKGATGTATEDRNDLVVM